MTPELAMRQKLAQALLLARRRPVRKQDMEPGTGTNEAGPAVETNAPANYWNTDGDAS